MLLLQVNPKVEFLCVCLSTDTAGMCFSSRLHMQLHMFGQVPILCKTLCTVFSRKRFFPSVNSHMVKKIPCLFKDFLTVSMPAAELSPISVGGSVFLKEDFETPVESGYIF